MRKNVAAIFVALLVSGCVGGGEEAPPAAPQGFDDGDAGGPSADVEDGNETLPPPAAESAGPAIRHFDQTFDLTLTG
ncbi:MAG TPA: hypothetical protein VGB18_03940, partial [Candidatus Thermoplasmatota archaeon]